MTNLEMLVHFDRSGGIRALLCSWLAVLVLLTGCSESNPAVPVRGSVVYQGQPVRNGMIMFHPANDGGEGRYRPATGAIRPDGTFEISTFRSGDGVLPGSYLVSIRAVEREPQEEESSDVVWLIPSKYGDVKTSNLTATIPTDSKGPLDLRFELQD